MNTNQIGNLGELKVIEKCLKNNISVFLPFGDGNVIDMILVINNKCIKAQVKSSYTDEDGNVIFKMCSDNSNQKTQAHYYTNDEIDIYLCYSYVYDEVYLIPFKDAPKTRISIRHTAPKNNNKQVRMAEYYLFENQLKLL